MAIEISIMQLMYLILYSFIIIYYNNGTIRLTSSTYTRFAVGQAKRLNAKQHSEWTNQSSTFKTHSRQGTLSHPIALYQLHSYGVTAMEKHKPGFTR